MRPLVGGDRLLYLIFHYIVMFVFFNVIFSPKNAFTSFLKLASAAVVADSDGASRRSLPRKYGDAWQGQFVVGVWALFSVE